MKSFKRYLREFAIQSTSDYVFDTPSGEAGSLKIPISGPMFKRIWPDTIRTTVFHATDNLEKLGKLEGKKKSISAFFSMMSRYMEKGIATGGGIVAEMDADVLISASSDIMSEVDKTGRRWVEMSWFENAQRYGVGADFRKVEKDLTDLISNLITKHLSFEKLQSIRVGAGRDDFHVLADMKRHLEGDGKKLRLVIKDYFDGVEKIIKRHQKTMGGIFYGYAKSKRQTEESWDEQIVNNIKVKKIHLIDFTTKAPSLQDKLDSDKEYAKSKNWQIKVWDATETTDLEVYTREVVKKEIGR